MYKYQKHGIHFTYPKNWTLEENAMETTEGSLSLSHESGTFWTLQKYPRQTDPETIIWEAVEAMRSEYRDVECHRFEKIVADKLVIGFEMTFFYLDLMNSATVLCFEQGETMFVVFWQTGNQLIVVENETISTEETAQKITDSLLR